MNMSPISLETTATTAPTGLAAATPAGAQPAETDFADRLALVFAQQPAGQNLAAGIPTLQTLTLGPTLEVLTTPADQPDGDSLAQFAKAQGLDDEVVAWLFSDPAQMAAGSFMPPSPVAGLSVQPLSAGSGTVVPPPSLTASAPALPGSLPPAAAPGLPVAAVASTLALLSPGMNWLNPVDAGAKPAVPAAGTADTGIEALQTVSPFSLTASFASAAPVARATGAPQPQPAATPGNDVPVQVLTLEIEPELEALWDEAPGLEAAPDLLEAPADRPLTAAGASSGSGQALADDAPLASASTSGARAEGYEALSERVGEALAQRILSQVERGQWQVRLLLKPAKLGEVEIDLTMRGGELDASFRATNPVTRDLLNDGLSRLRDVLANAGMEIADLNVASGRSQQHGGNPTPRQSAGASTPSASAQDASAASPVSSVSTARRTPGSDWDVLV